METNLLRCQRLGIMDDDSLMDVSQEERCVYCNKYIEKNLSPTNPACEGRWCNEALDYWLEAPACVADAYRGYAGDVY